MYRRGIVPYCNIVTVVLSYTTMHVWPLDGALTPTFHYSCTAHFYFRDLFFMLNIHTIEIHCFISPVKSHVIILWFFSRLVKTDFKGAHHQNEHQTLHHLHYHQHGMLDSKPYFIWALGIEKKSNSKRGTEGSFFKNKLECTGGRW